MKQFALLFRMDITNPEAQPSKEQMKIYMEQWMTWLKGIAATQQLADGGNHFSQDGVVLKPKDTTIEGPYTSENLSVAGYILIYADSFDDAIIIAKKCPILQGENTSVEIRELASPGT